jgi:hypothetical protein
MRSVEAVVMAQKYASPYVDLRDAVMLIAERLYSVPDDRDALLGAAQNARVLAIAALRDGAIEAQGQLSVVADDARPADDWPGLEATVIAQHAPRTVTTDWWIGVGLDVQIQWFANTMSRKIGHTFEIMRAIRIKLADLDRVWPQERPTVTVGAQERPTVTVGQESAAIKALAEYLKTNQQMSRAKAAEWCKTAGYDLGARPFDRVWQGARLGAGLPRLAPAGRKPKSPR